MCGDTAFHLIKDIVGDIDILVGCLVIACPQLVETASHLIGSVYIYGLLTGGLGFRRAIEKVVGDVDVAGGIELYKMVGVHVKKRDAGYCEVLAMTGNDALA